MTKDKALKLALEALHYCEALNRPVHEQKIHAIAAIKEALAQPDAFEQGRQEGIKQEREACAKVCDRAVGDGHPDDMHSDGQWAALTLAAEIRARGNK